MGDDCAEIRDEVAADTKYRDGLVAAEVAGGRGTTGMMGFVTERLVGVENGFNILVDIWILLFEPGNAALTLDAGFVIGEIGTDAIKSGSAVRDGLVIVAVVEVFVGLDYFSPGKVVFFRQDNGGGWKF